MDNSEKMIAVGSILGPHGIKGECKVKISLEYLDFVLSNFKDLRFFDKHEKELKIKLKRHNNNIFIAQINEITNRNIIEELGKIALFCPSILLPSLAHDEFYYSDLRDKKIFSLNNELLGEVNNVMNFGAGDIIEIKFLDGNKEMFPFNKEIFLEIKEDSLIFAAPNFT